MPHADFVHLRVHSAYSLSEGALHLKDLGKLCADAAMPAVAITDTGNLFGALEFSDVMAGQGVQPIVGCLVALSRDDAGNGRSNGNGNGQNGRRPEPDEIVLLAQNETGYQNLLKLSSKAYLETDAGETAQVSLDDLRCHADGLILLTGGAGGPLGRLLLEGQADAAVALAAELASIYEGRCYVEIQRHGTAAEAQSEPGLLQIAYDLELPLVATNDVYFASRDMHEAHDVLLCIDQGVTIGVEDRLRVTAEHYFKSAAEMRELFADLPEAIDNTLVVACRCAYRAPERDPILPSFGDGAGEDEPTLMRRMAEEGLEARLEAHVFGPEVDEAARAEAAEPYRERLAFELDVIINMGFSGYFLIVADFIQWAKAHGVPVGPGRGSGAGSAVAWALKITDLDPLQFNLLFERFLNPDRISMPDFDIDFCQEKRDRVIHYVQEKYGHEQVAQIITFGKLQARAVLRDVGRVLEMPYGQVDRLCKLVPNNPANPVTLAQAIDGEQRLREERDADPTVKRLIDVSLRLEGLYRHASTHAAGVVIGDRPLEELVPLYRDPRSEMPVTQFNMKWVERAGLVKFDFLGLKTLTVLDRAVALVRAHGGEIDLDRLPLDDVRTYEMLQRAEAVGVFQFESSGMRDLLRDSQPSNIEDLIALVALYRPGPMENIPKYIACKHGRDKPEFLHETIEPVVADTYGVIIYQEQVMQIAQVFAGYTLGQADILRKAMGKKIKAEMAAQRGNFVDGAVARGVDKERAAYVFDLVDKFAGYGFNKAHSAGYALVAYQTAYLKANHPVEFVAASMCLDMGNTDKLNTFRQELARLEIELRPPDINRSDVEFVVEYDDGNHAGAIRYALAAIKNVGREAMRSIVDERRQNGPFNDIWDFAGRLDPRQVNKRQLENLARAGAFDSLNRNRAQMLDAVDLMLRYAQQAAADRDSNQVSLFGQAGGAEVPKPALPVVADWTTPDRLANEFDAVGFYMSAHPLDEYKSTLERASVNDFAYVRERAQRGGTWFRIAGTVLGRQERNSARGNRFAFVQMSDPTGMFEVTVFAEQLAVGREHLEAGNSVVMEVEARVDGEEPRLTVQKITPIAAFSAAAQGNIRVFLRDPAPLGPIKSLLSARESGRVAVSLLLSLEDCDKEVEVNLPGRFAIDARVRGAIKAVPGVVDVHEL